MLRRNASLAEMVSSVDDEPEALPEPEPFEPPPAPAPAPDPLPRVSPSLGRSPQLDTSTLRIDPRPQTRPGGMERLRAEALQSVISRVEDRHFNGLRDRFHWKRHKLVPRLVLGLVAIVAGGLAAYLSTRGDAPAPLPAAPAVAPAAIAAPPMVQVLVANDTIAAGNRVTVAALGWEDWPEAAVRADYITKEAAPGAATDMSGLVARSDILPGEPIRAQKLFEGGQSLLANMLAPGMRAVSATVSAEAASGGFVAPNDRVDVVLTKAATVGQVSTTILRDVRVLAINSRLGSGATTQTPEVGPEVGPQAGAEASQSFGTQAIATLELDPAAAEVLINATSAGRLSLVLRAAAEASAAPGADSAANQAIRLSSPFWTN